MNDSDLLITLFDYRNASAADFAALNAYDNRLRVERAPDALLSVEETIQWWQAAPPSLDAMLAVVREADGAVIGHAEFWSPLDQNNTHLLNCVLAVLPERRRQGIGRRLLGFAVTDATRRGASTLLLQTHGTVPAGEAFARRIGARRAQENHTSQLVLAAVDRNLLREWQQLLQSEEFEVGFWGDRFPEAELPAIADLISLLVNDRPHDRLDIKPQQWTPTQVREIDAANHAAGHRRLSAYLREKDVGAYAGYTHVMWQENRPHIVYQSRTVVYPQYRHRELERWLYAALLEQLLITHPSAHFLRTNDAESDAEMRARNDELGFRLHSSECLWQVETAQVERYLADSARLAPAV